MVKDLSKVWGIDGNSFLYYAHHLPDDASTINYRIQDRAKPIPEGWQKVGEAGSLLSLVRDVETWHAALSHPPSTEFASPIYRIRREEQHAYLGKRQNLHQVNMETLVKSSLAFVKGMFSQ
jgi:hypothetical protein